MRQRLRWRFGMGMACAAPLAARAAAGTAPTWFAVLPDVLCGVAALLLVGFALWLLYLALVQREAGDFSFRRHAGGFGGSSTGWQMSTSLARLVGGLALVLLALALTMARLPAQGDGKGGAAADEKAPRSEAKAPAAAASTASAASAAASAK